MHRTPHRTLLLTLALAAMAAPAAPAQQPTRPPAGPPDTVRLTGFTGSGAARERALEARLRGVPDGAHATAHVRTLSAVPHVAGTPAQQRTAEYVLRQMAAYGLDTSRTDFRVFMPYPDSTIVERLTPTRRRFRLEEPALPQDPTTKLPPWPAMNGTAGSGDVRAPVVYVNYGLADDYALLDSLGVSVRGKIVLARYGRSFRGIKAREAERRGAAALLLYSDPADDGYVRGDVYPKGPMRHPDAVQRGSVFNGEGDPSTPGWPSTAGARRVPSDSMAVVRIPVVPLGYRNASALLEPLGGPDIPAQSWQGGLPFRYHVGGTGVTARVGLWHQSGERALKTITNTFGVIRGREWPDEIVIIGGHRDAWGPGARDNVGGVTSILEAARAWGEAARAGLGPRRTLVFATWDAEEWGLVGSTEWVELMRDSLRGRVVAYINQDDAADGRYFGASATATLQALIRDVAREVRQPGDTVSVYDAWRRRAKVADTADVEVGDIGGGSDHLPFYGGMGIPALDYGFGGPGGVYHSAYDTWTFQSRFGDPGFLSAAAAGQVSALALARLAGADVLPYDYPALARRFAAAAEALHRSADAHEAALPLDTLDAAIADLARAGAAFTALRDSLLAGSQPPAAATLATVNALLRDVEPQLVRPSGLPGRRGPRNLAFAEDIDNGYADIAFPGVAETLRRGEVEPARLE
ncbi:MAG TPA: M20/M25/M40 family metallo-hydrolase, partial [Gemmatimonadales bacterium]|nr:M20/M25/M40 family metallo-hydrolase [Gemmatimonadales bacterium]